MAKISKSGEGKTLYIEVSVYPAGAADPTKNLTISCPDKDTRFKTSLSDGGLKKFKECILHFYSQHILERENNMTYRFKPVVKGDHWYVVTTQGGRTEEGHAITPTDSTRSHIDREIDNLVDQLNEVRKELKRKMK